jgi:CubicO group peptidase (beta-lactamase class C family)
MLRKISPSLLLLVATHTSANCPPPSERRLPFPPISVTELFVLQQNVTTELSNNLNYAASSDSLFANLSLSVSVTDMHETSLIGYNFGPPGSNVTTEHIFRIGSVSKVFAVYEALLNGLEFDDTAADWVPEFRSAGFDEITIGGLAGQISGLTRDCEFFPFKAKS